MHKRNRTFLAAAVAACLLAAGLASPAMAAGTASVGTIDEQSSLIDYTPTPVANTTPIWQHYPQTGPATDVMYADTRGARATLSFTGRTVTWMGWKKDTAGQAQIYIDNDLKGTVDNYSATAQYNVPIWKSAELAAGVHIIEIVVLGTSTQGAGGGTRVHIDGFIVSDAGTYQNGSSRFDYTGAGPWVSLDCGCNGGSIEYTESNASTVSFTFTGPNVSWYTATSQSGGVQDIYIDGGTTPVKSFNTDKASGDLEARVLAYAAHGLGSGPHTITIKSPGAGFTHHDAFVVGALTPAPARSTESYRAEFTRYPTTDTHTITTVTTPEQLDTALANAGPGTAIKLNRSTPFIGNFQLLADGTETNPIWIYGLESQVLKTPNMGDTGGKALELVGANHVRIGGFTVRDSFQGVQVRSSSDVAVTDLYVHRIGQEAIHLLYNTTDSFVISNVIEDTGLTDAEKGEGVYLGTSPTRWSKPTVPDVSSRNMVAGNTIINTGANHIEAKPGTKDGVIRDNNMNGYQGAGTAKGMIQVGGDNYQIIRNTHTNARAYALATIAYEIYGHGNIWRANSGSTFTGPSTYAVPAMGYFHSGSPPRTVFYGCGNNFSDPAIAGDSEFFEPSNVYCIP